MTAQISRAVSLQEETAVSPIHKFNRTSNVHISLTLRRVSQTIVTEETQ
jgi:hypothetical protein